MPAMISRADAAKIKKPRASRAKSPAVDDAPADPVNGKASPVAVGRVSQEAIIAALAQPQGRNFFARVFGLDPRTVTKRLSGIMPAAEERGNPLWVLQDVAGALTSSLSTEGQIEEAIQNMSPKDLPALLSPAFWDGQIKRHDYFEKANDSWSTETVMTVLSGAFQELRDSLLRLPETVIKGLAKPGDPDPGKDRADPIALSDAQRTIIEKIVMTLLSDLNVALIAKSETLMQEARAGELHAIIETDRVNAMMANPDIDD